MFGSNALSLPPAFAQEHRPLRLTSEGARHPAGECRYELPHPAPQKQKCACQYFHHNRSAPGNICECGHQACFHVHDAPKNDKQPSSDLLSPTTLTSVLDRMKKLEESVQIERKNSENAMARERQMWEREVRVLREALAPFYKNEHEMRAKLTELEYRVEGNYDEQVRLRIRVEALDEANMTVERKIDEMGGNRAKKRRTGLSQSDDDALTNGHALADIRRTSSSIDDRSVTTPSSRALSPHGLMPTPPEHEEARSSGILNLVEQHRAVPISMPQRLLPQPEEPRSSGFLHLDMSDRHSQKTASENGQENHQASPRNMAMERGTPPSYPGSIHDGVRMASRTPPDIVTIHAVPDGKHLEMITVIPISTSPKKRKHPTADSALKVLADVSARETLIH